MIGIEPIFLDSKSTVLPLDDTPTQINWFEKTMTKNKRPTLKTNIVIIERPN